MLGSWAQPATLHFSALPSDRIQPLLDIGLDYSACQMNRSKWSCKEAERLRRVKRCLIKAQQEHMLPGLVAAVYTSSSALETEVSNTHTHTRPPTVMADRVYAIYSRDFKCRLYLCTPPLVKESRLEINLVWPDVQFEACCGRKCWLRIRVPLVPSCVQM